MSSYVLASPAADLGGPLSAATSGALRILPPARLTADPAQLFTQFEETATPDVLILDSRTQAAEALQLTAALHEQCPTISVVLISDRPGDLGLAALRAGAHDILQPTASVNAMRDVLARALRVAQGPRRALHGEEPAAEPSRTGGRIISVVSPKGGVGKTTISTNLAVGLAQTAPLSTVLVDLDVQFGDVASSLNLNPEHFLPDAVHGPASRDTMVLKTFLTQHATGLYVICGPDTPAAADRVSGADVSHLLQMLSSEFTYVVVDTAPGLSEHALAALDETTDLVLLTSMDVPGLRGLRKELDILGELKMLGDRRQVVVNFADRRSGLAVADIEATIGAKVDVLLPRSKAVPASVNLGVPLLQSNTRDPMTKQLRRLVGSLTAPVSPSDQPPPRRAASRWGRHKAATP